MAGSLNIADTFAGAYTGFKQGAFNDDNQWVPGLAAAQQGLFDDNSPMNDSAGYNYVEPGIPDIFKPATSSTSLPYNSDLPMYGPYNNPNPSSSTSSVFDPTVQISPAGVTSDDGMMTEPAMYLYPGEEIGIDGVPYRPDAGQTDPAYSYEPNQGGGSAAGYTPSVPEVMLSQDLSQRAPSGTMYAPDLSAYNDSSLFNYTGPGGVGEYTYGQGLRTGGADYSIFGTPTDVANPYYEGQFAPMAQTIPVGPADGAINMNPVQLPSDLPQIEVSADVSMPAFNGLVPRPPSSSGDLTYQQTIDEMGIFGPDNPPPSTPFPSPGDMTETDKQYQDMLNQSLMDNQTQAEIAMGDRTGYSDKSTTTTIPGLTMDDTADIERGMITSQRGTTMDDTAAIEQGMRESQRGTTMDDTTAIQMGMMQGTPNPQLGLPVPEFNDLPEQGLTPLQQAARDAASNIDTRDFRFNPTGEQDKSLLQKWVESGPAYQPTSDADIKELEDVGNQVKSFADKTSQVRNLFDENVINTVGSPNQFEIQRAEADANQAALDKQRYNTQINNPTADFSGYMKNYGDGGGFKEAAPVESVFSGSPSAGIDANTAQEIAARTESMNAVDGNELMLEAIGLGSNLFNEVSKAEKEQAQKDMVNIFANAYNKTQDQPKPAVIKTTSKKPEPKRVTVKYNQNKPVKVAKTKPTGRGPQPFTPTRTTGSRSARRLTGGR